MPHDRRYMTMRKVIDWAYELRLPYNEQQARLYNTWGGPPRKAVNAFLVDLYICHPSGVAYAVACARRHIHVPLFRGVLLALRSRAHMQQSVALWKSVVSERLEAP